MAAQNWSNTFFALKRFFGFLVGEGLFQSFKKCFYENVPRQEKERSRLFEQPHKTDPTPLSLSLSSSLSLSFSRVDSSLFWVVSLTFFFLSLSLPVFLFLSLLFSFSIFVCFPLLFSNCIFLFLSLCASTYGR